MKRTAIIKRRRSEEERLRRHLYGDAGARFNARESYPDFSGVVGAITTLVTKDIPLLEIYEDER